MGLLDNITKIEVKGNKLNFSLPITVSIKDMEDVLNSFSYDSSLLMDETTVNENLLLPFPKAFMTYLGNKGTIPTVEQFWKYYCRGLLEECGKDTFVLRKDKSIKVEPFEVQSILYKNYPILVRDYHLFLLLSESSLFESVKLFVGNLGKKIVIGICHKGKRFTITSFLPNENKFYYKLRNLDIKETELNSVLKRVGKQKLVKVGDFLLCSEDVPCDILEEIYKFFM